VFDDQIEKFAPFDGALSRYVLHHVVEPARFLARQFELLKPGGVLVVCDHLTDPNPAIAQHHNAIEVARDKTHTRNLTGGQLVDLFATIGLKSIQLTEEKFVLDFDEWFDRGTPAQSKDVVRDLLLSGPAIRTYRATLLPSGAVQIDGIRATVRGRKT
jgi:SAM-dependent methyltransferase